ncbi:hypothetical protein [Peterkaempfera griseoplana]|uniref:hypothetical protein n=1 Tax=Peterkaempfera griseoplana TaxID=66896 RepID=UPI0006E386A3|nr:hypothetical protein [Peterkaempfera griseoplana]
MTSIDDYPPAQEALHAAELAEHEALALLDRALRLARRLTCTDLGNLRQPWPPLANRAVTLALAFHDRAERATRTVEDMLAHLEGNAR